MKRILPVMLLGMGLVVLVAVSVALAGCQGMSESTGGDNGQVSYGEYCRWGVYWCHLYNPTPVGKRCCCPDFCGLVSDW